MGSQVTPSADLSKFDWKTIDKTTPVRDQENLSICWSFATIAGVEHNLLKKGLAEYRNLLDLNEQNYAYHAKNRDKGADVLGNTDYDLRDYERKFDSWTSGYNPKKSAYSLLQWNSLQDQSAHFSDYNSNFRFKTTDVIWLDHTNRREIKEAIVKYGSVVMSYMDFKNRNSKYHYNPSNTLKDANDFGHAALIVGWDDEMSADLFAGREGKPSEKGAFLVKNSWGDQWGEEGYFWLSYGSALKQAFSVDVERDTKYDFNYYYDGLFYDSDIVIKNSKKAAVLFRAQKEDLKQSEFLQAINVGLKGAKGGKLHVKVYKDLGYDFATIGSQHSPVLEKTYDIANDGFISFDLGDNAVELQKNKSFAISVEVESEKGEILFSSEPSSTNDFSYYYEDNTWKNSLVENKLVARIKAWTKLKVKTKTQEEQSQLAVKDLKYADVVFSKNTFRYGDAIDKPIVKYNGIALTEGKDYTLTFTDKLDTTRGYYSNEAVLNGNGLVTIKGEGEYSNQIEIPYFYQVGLNPKLEVQGGQFKELKDLTLNSNWQLVNDGQYLSYVGSDKNNYRNTMLSADQVRQSISNSQSTNSQAVVPTLLNPVSSPVSNPVHHVSNDSQTTTPELTSTITSSVSHPGETPGSSLTLTASLGGAGFLGLFSLIPLLFKKFH